MIKTKDEGGRAESADPSVSSSDSDTGGFCPQCQIRALQAQLTAEGIQAAALSMKAQPGITAEDGLYQARLQVCAACPRLQGGLVCAECGSYVAYRARLQAATCPYPGQNKWRFQ